MQALAEEFYLLLGGVHAGKYQDREYGHLDACDMVICSDSNSYRREYPDASGGSYADDDSVASEENRADPG